MIRNTKYFIALIVGLTVFSGCKPKQIIQEKVITKFDSTKVIALNEELQKKTIEIEALKTDLARTKDEVSRLESESSTHTINYDTTAPLNPDGQYPKQSETITQSKILLDKTIKEMEAIKKDYAREVNNLELENKNLKTTIESLREENKNIKEETTPTTGFNFRLFFFGVLVGIVLIICIRMLLKRAKIM
jgi:regulator of replication initiation timing